MRWMRWTFGVGAIVCLLASYRTILEAIGIGMAMSGWIGLRGYESQIRTAQGMVRQAEWRFLWWQLAGGCCLFGVAHTKRRSLLWAPAYWIGYSAATALSATLIFEITAVGWSSITGPAIVAVVTIWMRRLILRANPSKSTNRDQEDPTTNSAETH